VEVEQEEREPPVVNLVGQAVVVVRIQIQQVPPEVQTQAVEVEAVPTDLELGVMVDLVW
jgi:hypothetical protein